MYDWEKYIKYVLLIRCNTKIWRFTWSKGMFFSLSASKLLYPPISSKRLKFNRI